MYFSIACYELVKAYTCANELNPQFHYQLQCWLFYAAILDQSESRHSPFEKLQRKMGKYGFNNNIDCKLECECLSKMNSR